MYLWCRFSVGRNGCFCYILQSGFFQKCFWSTRAVRSGTFPGAGWQVPAIALPVHNTHGGSNPKVFLRPFPYRCGNASSRFQHPYHFICRHLHIRKNIKPSGSWQHQSADREKEVHLHLGHCLYIRQLFSLFIFFAMATMSSARSVMMTLPSGIMAAIVRPGSPVPAAMSIILSLPDGLIEEIIASPMGRRKSIVSSSHFFQPGKICSRQLFAGSWFLRVAFP